MITLNDLESDRFGVLFGRMTMTGNAGCAREVADAIDTADRSGIAVLSARLDVTELPSIRMLEDLGFRIMDTLVYYRRTLPTNYEESSHRKDGSYLTRLSVADAQACSAIARVAFRNYLGHYHADPRLSNTAADAAYVDWAERLVLQPEAGSISLGICADSKIQGFITGVPRSNKSSEIILNAVHPDAQRRGFYEALLKKYLREATSRGDLNVMISTQIQNYPVQRIWCKLGFSPFKSLHTFHRWSPLT